MTANNFLNDARKLMASAQRECAGKLDFIKKAATTTSTLSVNSPARSYDPIDLKFDGKTLQRMKIVREGDYMTFGLESREGAPDVEHLEAHVVFTLTRDLRADNQADCERLERLLSDIDTALRVSYDRSVYASVQRLKKQDKISTEEIQQIVVEQAEQPCVSMATVHDDLFQFVEVHIKAAEAVEAFVAEEALIFSKKPVSTKS